MSHVIWACFSRSGPSILLPFMYVVNRTYRYKKTHLGPKRCILHCLGPFWSFPSLQALPFSVYHIEYRLIQNKKVKKAYLGPKQCKMCRLGQFSSAPSSKSWWWWCWCSTSWCPSHSCRNVRILLESTRIHWNGTGIHRNETRFHRNYYIPAGIELESAGMEYIKWNCLYIYICLYLLNSLCIYKCYAIFVFIDLLIFI